MTSLNKPGNADVNTLNITTRCVSVVQLVLSCGIGGFSLYMVYSHCMENVYCDRAKNTGILVICTGVPQLVCTCVTVDKHKLKFMCATYVVWNVWVMISFGLHWMTIYDITQATVYFKYHNRIPSIFRCVITIVDIEEEQSWSELVIISTVLMTLYVVLTIGLSVTYVYFIKQLDRISYTVYQKYGE